MDGRKDDDGKTDWSVLDLCGLEDMVKVLSFGAQKYGRDNWQKVDNARNRYFSAAMRHLTAWQNGEQADAESGLPHLAHAMTNLYFLQWFEANGVTGRKGVKNES